MIKEFKGEYAYLSNFYPARFQWQGFFVPTVEHAFQAAKVWPARADWKGAAGEIIAAPTPSKAKYLGRSVKLRPDWEEVKLEVMLRLVFEKFCAHPDLADKLIATGDEMLYEGNNWGDTYWGVDLKSGVGYNFLGEIIMSVRSSLALVRGGPR